jgi:hypothetical protein
MCYGGVLVSKIPALISTISHGCCTVLVYINSPPPFPLTTKGGVIWQSYSGHLGSDYFGFGFLNLFCPHWYVPSLGRNIGPSQVLRTQITNTVQKRSSWKANHTSSSQIPSILQNPEFHLRVHKMTSLSISLAWSIQFTPLILFLEDPF